MDDIKKIAKDILLSDKPDIIACKTLAVGVRVMVKTKDEKVIQCTYTPLENGGGITIQSANYI